MTIAQQILEETKNSECQYLEAFKVAGSKGGVEEFRREMSTVFMFNDSSRLKFSGGCVDAMSSCGYSLDDIEATGYYMEPSSESPLATQPESFQTLSIINGEVDSVETHWPPELAGVVKVLTPSKRAKELGCESLIQVAEKTEQSEQTLINWFNNPKKRKLFEIVCKWVSNESINNNNNR